MEEGVPPPPLPPRPPMPPRPNSPHEAAPGDLSAAIIPFNKSTYVVQVPKDQIFRVPPPENARIVEEHQNRIRNQKNSQHFCCSRVACVLTILLVIALLCLGGILTFYFLANTGAPHFSVDHIAIARPSSTKPEFDITLKSQNPSATMDFCYTTGGTIDLFHKGRRIASGDPPTFTIGHQTTTDIKLSLPASKHALPDEFNSTARASKEVLPFSLSADFPVNVGLGALQMRKKEMHVRCDLKVSKMVKELHVVSQNCNAKF